jgi:hypothetical protein
LWLDTEKLWICDDIFRSREYPGTHLDELNRSRYRILAPNPAALDEIR